MRPKAQHKAHTAEDDRLVVAIMNDRADMAVAREEHWYRIPVASADKWLRDYWPPQWLAFYHTKAFGSDAHAIRYYARVLGIRQARRRELFPDASDHPRADRLYYQLLLEPLRELPAPVYSARWRRIVFIRSTLQKLMAATEINDLYRGSALEDRLWAELRRREIGAEREFLVTLRQRAFFLDFAVFCQNGKLDIETDGDTYHSDRERIPLDNDRDNVLQVAGWDVLRFNTPRIMEDMATYCIPAITEHVNRLGGVDEGKLAGRRVMPTPTGSVSQLSLFERPGPRRLDEGGRPEGGPSEGG